MSALGPPPPWWAQMAREEIAKAAERPYTPPLLIEEDPDAPAA